MKRKEKNKKKYEENSGGANALATATGIGINVLHTLGTTKKKGKKKKWHKIFMVYDWTVY